MPKKVTYRAYDLFARVYDRHWGREVPAQIVTVIDRLLVPSLPVGARILDVCCGTGYTASELGRRGFVVTGLDESEEMLRHARRNAPASGFILADARSFEMMPIYDGIISTFDSLNHIMTLEGLTSVCRNVHRALRPGGLFLFDMNMENGFLEHWAEYFAIVEDREVCILSGAYDVNERVGRYDITMFERRGKMWRRTDTSISEKYYPAKEIRMALKSVGFEDISAYDAEKELGLSDHVGRTFFLARKAYA
ncbi:MAG TPA: class I SAM-dependent methyltransferase [Pyrinomonadaceae bacterium]|jgi:SAM-dependent methyltransferase|nr:class I SAM-dependent methyltransferase [Pyrinomonadaceae bacterium]